MPSPALAFLSVSSRLDFLDLIPSTNTPRQHFPALSLYKESCSRAHGHLDERARHCLTSSREHNPRRVDASRVLLAIMGDAVVGIIGMGDMGKMYARRISKAGWRYAMPR